MARLANARTNHMTRWVIPVAKRLLIEEACKNASSQPLEEVAHIEMGQSPDGDSCNDDGDGIPLIGGPADLGLEFPQSTRWTNSPTKLCKPGDIIICVRATIGEPRWADGIYCLGRGVAGIRPVDKYLLPKFLFFIIEGNEQILQNQGTGTTFKTISKQHLASIQVPMIPVEEQEIIVSFLLWLEQNSNSRPNFLEAPSLPASLTNQLGIIARIEELAARIEEARGLRREVVEGTEKVISRVISNLQFDERYWTTIDAAVLDKKGSIRSGPFGSQLHHDEFVDSGVAAIGTRDVQVQPFTINSGWFVTHQKFEQFKRYQVFPGDVLVTIIGGSIGRFCVVPANVPLAFTTKHVVALTLNPSKAIPEFISYLLNFHTRCRTSLFSQSEGSAQPSLNSTKILKTEIPLPSLVEQRRIINYIDVIYAKVKVLQQLQSETSAELDALLPSILDKAFKGEL